MRWAHRQQAADHASATTCRSGPAHWLGDPWGQVVGAAAWVLPGRAQTPSTTQTGRAEAGACMDRLGVGGGPCCPRLNVQIPSRPCRWRRRAWIAAGAAFPEASSGLVSQTWTGRGGRSGPSAAKASTAGAGVVKKVTGISGVGTVSTVSGKAPTVQQDAQALHLCEPALVASDDSDS